LIFDWDEANREHVAVHDVTAQEAEEVIRNEPFDLETQTDEVDGFRYTEIVETNSGESL
jgi:hypothetical protein